MCFTTYLTNFYKHPACIYALSFIFDSNLKQYFKYGKRYSKYGKSRRELQGSNLEKGIAVLEYLSLHTQGETLQDIKSALDISQTTAYRILNTLVRLDY
ncbi:MAG: helix-turn-helix domain-containing protein [Parabacteroides merdae]